MRQAISVRSVRFLMHDTPFVMVARADLKIDPYISLPIVEVVRVDLKIDPYISLPISVGVSTSAKASLRIASTNCKRPSCICA